MDIARTRVTLHIWTWGENIALDVPAQDFLHNYYGAVTGIFNTHEGGKHPRSRMAAPQEQTSATYF
jgi:hypothetical protein